MKFKIWTALLLLTTIVARAEVKNVDVNEAEKLIAEKKVVILDVRTDAEFKEGHIAGATNINYLSKDFADKVSALDKSKSYLVHCAAGSRSAKAVKKMEALDFQTIYHLAPGFHGWEDAKKPVTKD